MIDNVGTLETVDPFVLTNFSFGYKFGESNGMPDGLALRLIIDNAFNVMPQTIKRLNTDNLSYNSFTLGRIIKLGASSKFPRPSEGTQHANGQAMQLSGRFASENWRQIAGGLIAFGEARKSTVLSNSIDTTKVAQH